MANVTIGPAKEGDAERLAANLRPADKLEIEASSGSDHLAAIKNAIALSDQVWTAEVDGEIACMFGVGPLSFLSDSGIPWALGTPVIDANARAYVRLSRMYIQQMLERYPHLFNAVDSRNKRAVRWLKSAGFTLHPAEPHPKSGVLFHRFELGEK